MIEMTKNIRIRVPATTANLGAGFDTFGLALNLENEFEISVVEDTYKIEIEGFKSDDLLDPNKNLFIKAYQKTCKKNGWKEKFIQIRAKNRIPMSGGLGSSATAVVGGVALARKLNRVSMNNVAILKDALSIEIHPDNISACIYGGFTITMIDGLDPIVFNEKIHHQVTCWVLHPIQDVNTQDSRKSLPETISIHDVIYSLSRASVFAVALMQGKWSFLKEAMKDKLHEPLRMDPKMNYPSLKKKLAMKEFYGWAISGSGPSVVTFCAKITTEMEKIVKDHFVQRNIEYNTYSLKIQNQGLSLIEKDTN